jgi:hypothetical protein
MSEDRTDAELNLGPLIELVNAEVQAALDAIEQRSPANIRITSLRVAMGQEDGTGTPSSEAAVLRKGDYSLSDQGWMIELAFGGGSGRARQRGGDWIPLPKTQPREDQTREGDEEQARKRPSSTGWRAFWKGVLQRFQFLFLLTSRFLRWVAT